MNEENMDLPDGLEIVEEICALAKKLKDEKTAKGNKADMLECWLEAERLIREKYEIKNIRNQTGKPQAK